MIDKQLINDLIKEYARESILVMSQSLRNMADTPEMLDLGGPAALIRAAEAFESAVRKS